MFRPLTREKQQLSHEECVQILTQIPRGVLSLHGDDGYPYGVPIDHWFCEEDGCLYFNTPQALLRLPLAGGEAETVLAPDTSAGQLYGVAVRDGRLCCSLSDGAEAVDYEILDMGIDASAAWGY